jgi:hypothetical protein
LISVVQQKRIGGDEQRSYLLFSDGSKGPLEGYFVAGILVHDKCVRVSL